MSEPGHARSSRPLWRAWHDIETARRDLTDPGVGAARDAIEDLHRLTVTLAGLVEDLIDHTPVALDGNHRHIGDELVRDLKAAHGCLTTAGLLIAPALDDLRELPPGTPGADAGEQQRPAIAVIDGDS